MIVSERRDTFLSRESALDANRLTVVLRDANVSCEKCVEVINHMVALRPGLCVKSIGMILNNHNQMVSKHWQSMPTSAEHNHSQLQCAAN